MRGSSFIAAIVAVLATLATANPVHLERRDPVTITPNAGQPNANVALQQYTFDPVTNAVSGTIWIRNIAFAKVVKAIYSSPQGAWNNNANQISASYKQSVANNFELWSFTATAPANLGSGSQLYLRYDVAGQSYYDNNFQQNYLLGSSNGGNGGGSSTSTPVTVVQANVPAQEDSRALIVNSYSCRGSTLSGGVWIRDDAVDKKVTITVSDPSGKSWVYTAAADYSGNHWGYDNPRFQLWTWSKTLYGIGTGSQFYVRYEVLGNTYYDSNGGPGINYKITCIDAPPATTGLQADVDALYTAALPKVKTYLFNNISPPGVAKGFIVAGGKDQPSTTQNYFFFWTRDSALVMDAVNKLYAADSSYEKYFWDYLDISKKLQNARTISNPNLGEPKFTKELEGYMEGWCRPQNDGPALRVNGLVRFINNYLSKGGSLDTVRDIYNGATYGIIKKDLDFLVKNGTYTDSCDLWEENHPSRHLFTLSAIRTALKFGSDLARRLGDTFSADRYAAASASYDLSKFWFKGTVWAIFKPDVDDGKRQFDASITLSALHTYANDGVYGPTDDKILSTVYVMATKFIAEFPVNARATSDGDKRPLAPALGRYFAD
ncbi:glycoside hydrolase 15 protein, partial [Phlyctochytrium bullatum]